MHDILFSTPAYENNNNVDIFERYFSGRDLIPLCFLKWTFYFLVFLFREHVENLLKVLMKSLGFHIRYIYFEPYHGKHKEK